jgi:S-DNA-T family DNA segregation ATPase FtsK/SpoIIIE
MIREFLFKQQIKSKLKYTFNCAGIYLKRKSGDKEYKIFPKIHAIVKKDKENCTEITFTLLNGLDPKELIKKLFVFKQVFGQSIELKGEVKKFTLYIYNQPLKLHLIYKYEEILPYLEGMFLPIVTGNAKNGKCLVLDALDLPHVIIQGTTGSGKSSAIRVILTTLIKYKKPSELEIYCIDGKKAEFGLFKKVEHVKSVVHSNKHARETLRYISKVMSKREDLLDTFDVPHINDLPIEHKQKFILVAVDEFIEYLDDKEIMTEIIKISSKGRAVGIILLASAQRMDADVMDTKARGNFNIRMSFRAVDRINARLIGCDGAEKIKREEKGRFILNSGDIEELQSPHLTYDEARNLLNQYYVSKSDLNDITKVHPEPSFCQVRNEPNKITDDKLDFFLE